MYPMVDTVARYGYLGVHLFFMISGFVILLSAEGSSPRNFFASRAARLYPAFWAAATMTALATWLTNSQFAVSLHIYFINITMLAHWFNTSFVDGAYWSLAVELHFYIYVWLALQFRILHRVEWLLTAWLLVSMANALRPMWPVEFWLNARWAPFFVAGSACFLIRVHGHSITRTLLLIVAYVLALFYGVNETTQYNLQTPDDLNVNIVVGSITLFFVIFGAIALNRWSLKPSASITLIGVLTYPVYLLHQYLGYVLFGTLNNETALPLLSLFLTTITIIGLAYCVHIGIEKKLGPLLRNAFITKRGGSI